MISDYTHKKTLSDQNQFHFACPVFGSETAISACFTLRDMVWRGEKPPVRKGCQLCMRANKCPINNIITDMRSVGNDPYYSETKKVGKLQERHIAGIERVLVLERDICRAEENGDLSLMEAKKIREGNLAAGNLASGKTPARVPSQMSMEDVASVYYRAKRRTADGELEAVSPKLAETIVAPDMAAAINKAMEAS